MKTSSLFSVADPPCRHHNAEAMKISDDYRGKIALWAREGKPYRLPKIANLPSFGHRRFNSYEELNAWKKSLLDELLKRGGAQWTK